MALKKKNPHFLLFFKSSTLFSRLFPGLENCFAISRLSTSHVSRALDNLRWRVLSTSHGSRALDNLRWRVLLADTKLNRKMGQNFFPKTVPQCNSRQHDPVFATLRLRGRPGRDGCQTALWVCFGGRTFNTAANSSPKTVPQCTLTTITTRSPAQP